MAEGRLVLALGAGFPYPKSEAEFASVGVPFEGRLGLLGRTVDAWRAAWRGEVADGFPTPTCASGPPLWFAGGGPSAARVIAARFDGWLPYLPTPQAYRDALDDVVGVATRPVTAALYATVLIGDDPGPALDAYTQACYGVPYELLASFQAYMSGPADAVADGLRAFGRRRRARRAPHRFARSSGRARSGRRARARGPADARVSVTARARPAATRASASGSPAARTPPRAR